MPNIESVEERVARIKEFLPSNVNKLDPADFYFAYKQGLLEDHLLETKKALAPHQIEVDIAEMSKSERDKFIAESPLPADVLAKQFGISKTRIYGIRRENAKN